MISIVTPILNEEKQIINFLNNLRDLEGVFEAILVDGGSSDHTLEEVVRSIEGFCHPVRFLQSDRGRAIQMNRGAEEARGEILFFLHSDCRISRDALKVIERVISKQEAIGGGFKHTFSDSNIFLRVLSGFGNFRAGLTKIFFGDYGIFLRRDVFQKIGGYDKISFLEDVELCKKAKKYGRLSQIDRYISASPRRFLANGEIAVTVAYTIAYGLNIFGFKPSFLKKYFMRGEK
ncbi:TIGR04283 family arsenosugar biosynthesis glycosyltransferase [Candidatus Bathyarchaeota archaeon]|nr:TIGR04283 family arsenosugar biosynthesis glycosyltransferase [Candidatus Bathyarchaeota archaeon]